MSDFGRQIESSGGLGLRDDLDTLAECGAFDHFRQLILVFSIAARFSTPLV
jgi:hypothetical protein